MFLLFRRALYKVADVNFYVNKGLLNTTTTTCNTYSTYGGNTIYSDLTYGPLYG